MSNIDQAKEEEFHDKWAASVDVEKIEVKALFESPSCPENLQILEWMGNLKGKKILEIGCGLGESSVYFATQGGQVTASDLSEGMLEVTRRLAKRHGVTLQTLKVSAMDMSAIPNGAYDYVYAANLLHHVDIALFIKDIKSKLKPGGTAFFWDPVHYNPVINVYRSMATQVRTEDEHPLKRADLDLIRREFASVECRFTWYSALAVFLKFYLVDRIHPNQSRYWKKIIDDAARIGPWLKMLHKIDRALFAWVPGLRWLGWNIVIKAEAKK